MAGNSFGEIFRFTTFGESHGAAIGVIVDGTPAGVPLNLEMIQHELDRRRPGQSKLTTQRKESDSAEILSGVFEGVTTGTPIAIIIRNQDQRSQDYSAIKDIFRPGHADSGYFQKYGVRDYRGGGRSSGRETAARVAAGAVAKQILKHFNISVLTYVTRVGKIAAEQFLPDTIEDNPVRCADPNAATAMAEEIRAALSERDSVGGIVECRIEGVMPGLGEPAFDKLDAELAKAALSIGGVKAIEFGRGFEVASMRGSQNNDQFDHGYVSNNAGGILGGISNGEPIIFRIAVKPTPSIAQPQKCSGKNGESTQCVINGRHDPCLCPRIAVVLEAMAATVVADMILRNRAAKI